MLAAVRETVLGVVAVAARVHLNAPLHRRVAVVDVCLCTTLGDSPISNVKKLLNHNLSVSSLALLFFFSVCVSRSAMARGTF